ncbi:MAG: ATP-dependent DNA ligase [Candidatus Aenigmatarchaeota archaeon]
MEYSKLVEVYESLEATSSKLGKRDILARLLKGSPTADLEKIVLLATGQVFPSYSEEELGIAEKMMRRAIEKATGHSDVQVTSEFKKTGDLGITTENFVRSRSQSTLMRRKLTVDKVFNSLRKLPGMSGGGSQDRKLGLIAELVSSASPKEAKYIVRTALGTLRIGVAEGIVRDAIAEAFDVDAANVEHAWNMMPDYGRIASIAKSKGDAGLKRVDINIGTSLQVLLAEKAPDLKTAMEAFDRPIVEVKYDGARVQIHKDGGAVRLFTRRLEEVTRQFPDIVRMVKEHVKAGTCVLDCEAVGMDRRTGKPLPFQQLSQRIQRKYGIERMADELPVQVNVFDVMYADGRSLLEEKLSERRELMQKIIRVLPGKFQFTEHVVTKDLKEAEKFYRHALEIGEEGVMVKNLDSKYIPGRRVGYWLKVKPTMEPLDLVIVGADWGTGKRANWLSSFILGCRDPGTGEFLQCGMMGTGLTDEQFKEMTKRLKATIFEERGRSVKFKPSIVLEIGYQEIQRSPTYDSGFALRFPRLLRDRSADKGPDEADTIERMRKLYRSQKKKA